MMALKLRLRFLHRDSVFLFSSLILILIIGFIHIIPLPLFFHIVFVFFPYIYITLYFDLYLSTWGKAWILTTTLLIFASLAYLDHPYVPFILVHVPLLLFLLGTKFISYKHQIQQRQLHQRHIKAMRVMIRQNLPLIQTVDYSREAVILLDKTGVIIDSNPQSCLLLSLSESFLIGQPIFNILGILANFDPSSSPENGEFIWGTQKKIIKFRTKPLLNHDIPSGMLLTLFDISEAINRMEANEQVAKFSAINKVSAGLAHEIRNPLTTIKGFMQLIAPEQWPESFRPYQQLILNEIQSIDQVLSKFVLLTNPSAPQMQPLNMTECIQTMAQTIQHIRLMRDVTLTLELPSPPVYVMGDHDQLLQALLSLLNNAIEASPKGGKVIIRLTEYESHVRISVIDYGPGIPKDLRQRVLDPFFSTQADSTGLGLTIAYQIILAHHGMLHFSESVPPSGTEAMIDLPRLPKFKNNLSA
ncbi:kinase [Desulfosporosinus sp. Tol-M]|nr:kinase [Desulfosporosinus sp. Tol-M]